MAVGAQSDGRPAETLFADVFGGTVDASPMYVIRPNDILGIFVYGEPELSRTVLVRPDGRISVPLAQDVQAAGLSPGQLKDALELRLGDTLQVPDVTVMVEAIQSYRVFVTGRVGQPGAITSETPISVLQALSLAGSFQEFAKPNETVIIRNPGPDGVIFEFHYDRVLKGESLEENMLLQSGDVVVVP